MVLTTINPSSFVIRSNGVLGALEVSTFIGLVLYGVSLSQGYSYFSRRQDDRFSLKLLVSVILLLETCHSFTTPIAIYQNTVTNWQEPEANSYSIATNAVAEILITLLVQCYFVYRIYRLSSKRIWISFVSLALVFLRFFGGAVIAVETYLDVPNRPNGISLVVRFSWLVTSALAIGGAADVFIAMCMTYYLVKLSSPTNKESTANIINRLIRWTLQTGLITSLTSVSVIICFQAIKNMVWFGLYIILAKVYSNSLLASLNARPLQQVQNNAPKNFTAIQFQAPISISFRGVLADHCCEEPEWDKTRPSEA
ncbi:hypothetical protein HYPSUDRAFT_444275 [Hypholoma sublateritium FD-334 SS-4]|uniref:DUF6534 domain-containing protein n=1 Tax=Hypholoma sublateritium (strain FD-334 SS-4) TaxID=945553 RepID=A0A0D2LUA9_HYPSF|nr:hypothetical protein HYPSUDRAFT_444275 [Hypholoma sublateritium FD-334 SS-4]